MSTVAVAMGLLPNGKVMMWSAEDRFSFSGITGVGYPTVTSIFDPATNTSTEQPLNSNNHNMFCPGIALLPDGTMLVNGGIDSPKTSLYDYRSNTWSAQATMNVPRGYNASTLLSDGTVFTLGGSWSGPIGGKLGEVWSAGTGWRTLPGVPADPMTGTDPEGVFRADNHMWMFAAANNWVFQAGPSPQMNWIDTKGSGSYRGAGNRLDDPMAINASVVMYDVGKIFKSGGATAYYNAPATTSTYVIDISAGPPNAPSVRKTASMTYPRAFANGVVLPNGQVVVIGGQTTPLAFDDEGAVLRPEIWDPVTETFTLLAPMQTPRTYHGTALLLPDGRVMSAGSGLCGDGCPANHLNIEILTPPYLLTATGQPAARPIVTNAPAQSTPGATITVTTDSSVSAFALVRMSATTHTINTDQRRIPLAFTSQGGNSWQMTLPSSTGVVLPGYYMLFAMNANGVPSVAKFIRIN